jgi:hypothetical protein
MQEKQDDMLKYNLTYITHLEQTAIISLCSINWLVFVTEIECVYCALQSAIYNSGCVFCVYLRTNSDYFPIQH